MSASAEIRYIMRPEIGLWGITAARGGGDSRAHADLISDVAHDLAPQATLVARTESARRALRGVLGSRTGLLGKPEGLAAIFFLAERTECALLWSGAVRVIRIRNGTATELLAGERPSEAAAAIDFPAMPPSDRAGTDDGGLLALLAAPVTEEPALDVRYEQLEAGDLWVLGIEDSIPQPLIARLASTWSGMLPAADDARDPGVVPRLKGVLDSVLAPTDPLSDVTESSAPLLLIAARGA